MTPPSGIIAACLHNWFCLNEIILMNIFIDRFAGVIEAPSTSGDYPFGLIDLGVQKFHHSANACKHIRQRKTTTTTNTTQNILRFSLGILR